MSQFVVYLFDSCGLCDGRVQQCSASSAVQDDEVACRQLSMTVSEQLR